MWACQNRSISIIQTVPLFSQFKFLLLQFVINKKLKPLLITFPVNLHQSIEQLKAQQNEKYFYQPGNIINEQ